jgi:hypothetical protein
MIINMKNLFLIATIFLISACASKEKRICPTEAEEAVSTCRAEEFCKYASTATGPGAHMGLGLGVGLGNLSVGVGGSRPIGSYSRCYDENMLMQKNKSEAVN